MPINDEINDELYRAIVYAELRITRSRLDKINAIYTSFHEAVEDEFAAIESSWPALKTYTGNLHKHLTKIYDESLSCNIQACLLNSFDYPEKLSRLSNPPLYFFYQGDITCISQVPKWLTIVGSRYYTKYGETIINTIIKPFLNKDCGVVSGLALGIDGLGHRAALESGAKTIGVIGSGLDNDSFFPYEHKTLRDQIIQHGGLVISEYSAGTHATKFSFPQRNRLLAALGDLVYVVQAKSGSGSLQTAEFADSMNIPVCTSPGSVFETFLEGNNQLIQNGATVITNPDDLRSVILGRSSTNTTSSITQSQNLTNQESQKQVNKPELSHIQNQIYSKIQSGFVSSEIIAGVLGLPMIQIQQELTMMEISGVIVSTGANTWSLL